MTVLESLLKRKLLECEKAGDLAGAIAMMKELADERARNYEILKTHPVVAKAIADLNRESEWKPYCEERLLAALKNYQAARLTAEKEWR